MKRHRPPRVAETVLSWLLKDDWQTPLGDFEEYYNSLLEEHGPLRARWWYRRQVIGLLPTRLYEKAYWCIIMLISYLRIAYRNLKKQTGYTLINIIGLSVGLTCFILIGLFVRFELSYDAFHEKADRIVRIVKEDPGNYYLGTNQFAVTSAPMTDALMEEFPEVEHAVQIYPIDVLLSMDQQRSYEEGLAVTAHFFDIFSFDVLQGNPATALNEPNTILLTESLAKKYFNDENPVGETLEYIRGKESGVLKIAGIVADPPPNSHFSFDYLLSINTLSSYREYLEVNHWDSSSYYTYASLLPGYDHAAFEEKLIQLARTNLSQYNYYKNNPDKISIFFPQALTDIHLHSRLNFEIASNGDIRYVYLFSAIGILILLIACINYMNLATARSAQRAKEVGVRKVMGAYRSQLFGQFMGEAMVLTGVAIALALILVFFLLPVFNALTARDMSLSWIADPVFLLILTGIAIGVGLFSGSYPALVMSQIRPAWVIKGMTGQRTGKPLMRNILVVAQFAITVFLVACTLSIYQQLHYIQNSQTGVDREYIVSIEVEDREARPHYRVLKERLMQHPQVLDVTASWSNPVQIRQQSGTTSWEGAEEGQHISVYHTSTKPGYASFFGIELVKGRYFSEASTSDEREGMLINETMAQQLGWDNPIGKWFDFRDRQYRIIGVMKDFNFLSFHQAMEPLALYLDDEHKYSRVLVKIQGDNIQESIAHMEATMADFSPAFPFMYDFLDDVFNRMYETEVRLGQLLSYFTILALLIACLGLLGLSAFMASKRTKEIGVRKVLGASLSDILFLLSKDFVKLVAIAFIIAVPPSYILLQRWLSDFAYRIELGPGVFLIAGIGVVLVAILTVSYQSMKAARLDPVESLHYE